MALDYSQYLRDKFKEDFEEAETQFSQNLPLRSHLREILEYIQKEEKFKSSSVLKQMKDCFMKLNDALADCILFAENSSRKILPSARLCKDYWLLIKTRLRLQRIRRKLMNSKESDSGGAYDRQETYPLIYARRTHEDSHNPFEELFDLRNVKYHGLDEQAKRIQDFLRQGKDAIAIVGMGGSGKTALARKVLIETYKNQFEVSAWISLTEATDLHNLTEMKVTFVSKYFRYRPSNLRVFLEFLDIEVVKYKDMKKKILIVVDGVWHAAAGIEYLTDFLSNVENITVVVASRGEGAAKSLAPPGKNFYLHRMEPLKEEACWSIFEDSIRRKQLTTSDGKRLSLEETEIFARIKNEIMENCCGLPLAAKSLAEVLSSRLGEKDFWTDLNVLKVVTMRVEADFPIFDSLKDKLSDNLQISSMNIICREECICKLSTYIDPRQLLKELGPCHHVELISVDQEDWSQQV